MRDITKLIRDVSEASSARKWLQLLMAVTALWITVGEIGGAQQPRVRLNRLIEALDAGKPGIAGDSFVWVEGEHRAYDITRLTATLETLLATKNDKGQIALAPIVR